MQWHSFSEFIAMGGYGFYVWGSFGFTFLVMGLELWLLNKRRQSVTQAVKQEAI
jgi:heme exporter protein D